MSYFPGHKYFLRAIASTTTINETTGALATPSAIADAADIGYTGPNDVTSDEGTKIGYAAGRRKGAYLARGARTHTLAANLRLGSVDFIKDNCIQTDETLPWLDLFFGVSGSWVEALYRARCAKLSLAFQEGSAQELTAAATFEAIARDTVSPVTLGYDFEEFGPALLWTDVHEFKIGDTAILDKVTGLSIDIDHQLERKSPRQDYGDNVPASRTSRDLLIHHAVITGQITLHDLPSIQAALFTGSASAMNWSNITVKVNDVASSQIYDVTLVNPSPARRQQGAVESSAQMSFTVPIVAEDVQIAVSRD